MSTCASETPRTASFLSAADPACHLPPPPELAVAVAQFNAGAYFACHETLEALWLAEGRPVRDLYKGLLQIGVALHHQGNANQRGAQRLLASGMALLTPFAPRCQGVDIAGLLSQAQTVGQWLDQAAAHDPLPLALAPRIALLS